MADRLGADIAGRAVADAQPRVQPFAVERRAAVHAVAEAQHCMAVVLGLDDELGAPGCRWPAGRAARSSACRSPSLRTSSAGRTSATSQTSAALALAVVSISVVASLPAICTRACCVSGAIAVRSSG